MIKTKKRSVLLVAIPYTCHASFSQGSPAAYHILIAFAHRSQKTDAIPDLASELEAKGIPLAPTTFCTLVEAYARSKQCEHAQLWFDKLRDAERTNKWSTVSSAYWAMMDMYEKVGKPSEAARVWRALVERRGVHTRAVYTYNRLLDGLGKQGLFEEAMEMVDDMKSRGVQPDTTTYNILINCYGKVGFYLWQTKGLLDFTTVKIKMLWEVGQVRLSYVRSY